MAHFLTRLLSSSPFTSSSPSLGIEEHAVLFLNKFDYSLLMSVDPAGNRGQEKL